jgi:hypothetical protein
LSRAENKSGCVIFFSKAHHARPVQTRLELE